MSFTAASRNMRLDAFEGWSGVVDGAGHRGVEERARALGPLLEEVVDILAATLIQMLARGLEPDRDDQADKEEPAAEAEAEPCH